MAAREPDGSKILGAFDPLFAPKSIAVVGASATGVSAGNRFIRALKATKYNGQILPVHPTAREIGGITTILPAHPEWMSLFRSPGDVRDACA